MPFLGWRDMGTGSVYGFAFAAILVAVIGVFFFGEPAIVVAIVLLGIGVIALATEMDVLTTPLVPQPPPPLRYACPGCGGDVYAGQLTCPECGHTLPGVQTPKG